MPKPVWPEFYETVANRILSFNAKRQELFHLICGLAENEPLLHYLHLDEASFWKDRTLDPFTIMGIFNRHTTDEHRHDVALKFASALGITGVGPPEIFHGIPFLDPRNSIYHGGNEIWTLFISAIEKGASSNEFVKAFTDAINIKGNAISGLSMALYWARPFDYMPIDRISEPYLEKHYHVSIPGGKGSGFEYSAFLASLKKLMGGNTTFPEMALKAWSEGHKA